MVFEPSCARPGFIQSKRASQFWKSNKSKLSDRRIKKSAVVEENFLRALHSEFVICYRESAKKRNSMVAFASFKIDPLAFDPDVGFVY